MLGGSASRGAPSAAANAARLAFIGADCVEIADLTGTSSRFRLEHPRGLAVLPPGEVMMCDTPAMLNGFLRLVTIDPDGSRRDRPLDVCVADTHRVFVLAHSAAQVFVLVADGAPLIAAVPPPGELHAATMTLDETTVYSAVAVSDSEVLVADAGGVALLHPPRTHDALGTRSGVAVDDVEIRQLIVDGRGAYALGREGISRISLDARLAGALVRPRGTRTQDMAATADGLVALSVDLTPQEVPVAWYLSTYTRELALVAEERIDVFFPVTAPIEIAMLGESLSVIAEDKRFVRPKSPDGKPARRPGVISEDAWREAREAVAEEERRRGSLFPGGKPFPIPSRDEDT